MSREEPTSHMRTPGPRRRADRTRVLYIHPAKQGADPPAAHVPMGRPYGLIPLGVPALVNVLRDAGIDVQGIVLPLERQLQPSFDLRAWLAAHPGAYAILIDMHWYEHTYGAIDVARVCKEVLPEAWTILGGLSASAFSHEILESCPQVDCVIRGDAERPLLRLVQRVVRARGDRRRVNVRSIPNLSWRDGGEVVENPLTYCASTADLDRLDFVNIDFLAHADRYHVHEYIVTDLQRTRQARDISRYRGRWICTARGCRYECSYCGGCRTAHQALAGRQGIVPRSPEAVVADLQRLEGQRVIQASLSYDIAELGEPYWRALFDGMAQAGVHIGLYNEFFQLPEPAFVDALAAHADLAHSCVALSPLSGAEAVRHLNGKRYSNAELFEVLEQLKRHGLSIFCYFSLNLPGEDNATIEETIDLAARIYDLYPHDRLKILTSLHTIDPLSPMGEHPDDFQIEVDMTSFHDYYEYCRQTQLALPLSRTELFRGFRPRRRAVSEPGARDLAHMADVWDAARQGRESSWWPVPPSW
ncbi:MAG: B12-binding domain-containing radical SAM protein [Anaerolineae bacterium]